MSATAVTAVSHGEPAATTAERYLVVNADDLGRTAGVNQGIFRAHERGIVTSASLMVRWPAAGQAAESIRAYPRLGVGLHVDLAEWSFRGGEWRCEYEVVSVDDAASVAEEVARQLERFRRLVGRDPAHLDSHQHVHRREPAGCVLLDVARRLGVPLRDCTPSVRYRGDFYGQTSRGEPYPEGIGVDALLGLMERLEPGVTEIACHPALGDPDDRTYGRERSVELATLCDPRVRLAAVELGIELRSFDDLRKRLPMGSRPWERDLRGRGIAALRAGDWLGASAWLRRALAIDPESTSAWVWLSKAEQQGGDAASALRSAERALALEPSWASVRLQFADALADEGRRAEAAKVLDELARAHGDDVQILRRVVRRLNQLDDDSRALEAAERLLELQPGDEDGRFTKASCLWRCGDREGAAAALDGAEARKPATIRAASRLFLEVGEPLRGWAAINSLPEDQVTRQLLLAAGHALRRAGAITAAQEAFERAVASAPQDADARHYRDVVAGEAIVLRDGWNPPTYGRRRFFRRVRGRVLHLVGHSAPHTQVGYTVRTQYLARAQRDAGLDPHVVTRLGYPWDEGVANAAARDDVQGVVYHRLPADSQIPVALGDRLSETLRRTAALVRELRPAVLHAASDYRNALVALALGRSFGIPVVYEVRGFWEETRLATQGAGAEERDSYRWHRERELECMQSVDAVVTLADVMKAELVRRGADETAITVVPNAVDTDAFRPVERDDALMRELGFGSDDVVLGYVSSLSAYEGLGFLLEAVADLAAGDEPVRCLLVGGGEERSALERRADELGIRDRVVFTGRVPHGDVLRHYSLIDIFVVPRTNDRVSQLVTPLKPYEAMAAGRAVVVSGVPALREMVVEGVSGLVFPPEDAAALARVVRPLIHDPRSRRALGASACEWVSRHRTWTANGLRYRDLYRTLGAV